MKIGLILCYLISFAAFAQTNPDLPNPSLLTKKYLEEISKREIGQTKFAVKQNNYRYGPMASARGGAQMESNSREIQESDVYKIGKKGKKELFLLNQYRGFQIISFEDGLENPKIQGRFPVYNNWNSEMYYIESQDKVLVVNTEYTYSQNYWQSNYNTILYLIDVADSSAPKIITQENIPGYLQESRMVGDVLYTITNNGNWNELKAQITSVKLSNNTLDTVDSKQLHSENRWVRTMNVVKDNNKFYVISTLSNWRNTGDFIDVHDITSDKGDIVKVFTAKARGAISERSETFMHKNHLFAVSNYQAQTAGSLQRVSVEAFPIAASAEVVESKENMRISVGDTNGLNASLQDVRVSGDLLYTFWVPANNIDPFDLFDISEPSKGLKHLGQLQFDGWISKAFPMEFNNKKYVLGLGWIVPATAENNRRYPQAKLFEIKKENNTYKHQVVASLTLDSAEVWASLNDLDKYFEVLEEAPGVFNILFPVTFSKNWKSGAKIVNADLNTLALSEGASIVAERDWLKRVFVNKEVRAVNTFSDLNLGSFNLADINGKGVAKVVSVLELARNIVDFQAISATEAVQIVKSDKSVELRTVPLDKSDAEKLDVSKTTSIPGTYQWHKIKNNKLFMITSVNKIIPNTDTNYFWYQNEVFDFASLHVVDLATSLVTTQRIDVAGIQDNNRYFYFNVQSTSTETQEIFTIANELYVLNGESLEKINIEESCQYFFKNENSSFSLQTIGSEIYAYNSFNLKIDGDENEAEPSNRYQSVSYVMPFAKKINLNKNNISCSASLNVPGKPVLIDQNFMVTSENERGFYPHIYYSYLPVGGGRFGGYSNNSKTYSLKFNSALEVEMVDILNKDITSGVFNKGFITYSNTESRIDIWSINIDGELVSKPSYLQNGGENSSMITVKKINKRDFLFMKSRDKVDLYEISAQKRLTKREVTSTFDLNKDDGSAEFIFSMEAITAGPDMSKLYISQGYFGMTEIIFK